MSTRPAKSACVFVLASVGSELLGIAEIGADATASCVVAGAASGADEEQADARSTSARVGAARAPAARRTRGGCTMKRGSVMAVPFVETAGGHQVGLKQGQDVGSAEGDELELDVVGVAEHEHRVAVAIGHGGARHPELGQARLPRVELGATGH